VTKVGKGRWRAGLGMASQQILPTVLIFRGEGGSLCFFV
jgi:hypothetical protein